MIKFDSRIGISRIHQLYYGVMFGLLLVIGASIGLNLWQWLIFISLAILVFFSIKTKPVLTHLVIDNNEVNLTLNRHGRQQFWQGTLLSATHYHHYAVLDFEIDEPIGERVRFCLFYDQIPKDDWRILSVLIHYL